MSLKKRYSCIFISKEKEKNPLYFELTILDKDLNNIVSQVNKEFDLNFKISSSHVDENFGILLKDNLTYDDSDILYICHSANLDIYIKNKQELINKSNLEQMLSLFLKFIKDKKLK